MRFLCVCLFAALAFFGQAPLAAAYGMTIEELYPQVVSADTIRARAADAIDEAMRAAGETRRYTAEPVSQPRDLRAPEGTVRFLASLPNGLRFWGNTIVTVDVFVDDALFRRFKCYFRVHLFDWVAVAARPIAPHQPITAADIRFEEQEIGTRERKFLLRGDEIEGKVVSRPISIGMAIPRAMLRAPVVLEAGAPVTLISRSNGVEVKMEGEALSSGREGEVIRVRNKSSRRVLNGRVLDAATVEIVD